VDSIGRPHFARAMIDLHPELIGEQNADTWNRVFTDWLGTDGAAYVSKTSMPIEEFVEAAKVRHRLLDCPPLGQLRR